MKILRFTKSTDVNGRHFARGDHYTFDDETAAQLIAAELAVDPDAPKAEAPAFVEEVTYSVETLKPAPKAKRGKK